MNKKTMNKLKLSLITIATIVSANVNAQTFYQCVREACPSGQYFDGVTCKSLPTQTSSKCPGGFVEQNGKCYAETCHLEFTKEKVVCQSSCPQYKSKNGVIFTCQNVGVGTAGAGGPVLYNQYCSALVRRGDCFDDRDRQGKGIYVCCNEYINL